MLQPLISYLKKNTFLGYFVAAGSGVLVQYLIGSTLCIGLLKMSFDQGISIGFLSSIPVGFYLTKVLAFDSKASGKSKRELGKYIFSLTIAYFITVYGAKLSLEIYNSFFGNKMITLPFMKHPVNILGTISHFTGMGLSFIFNFFFHKYLTFNDTGIVKKIRSLKPKN